MQHTKPHVSLKEIFCVAAVIAVTASILSPVIATTGGSSAVSNCQANLKRISSSLKMYLADWNDSYPTNRAGMNLLVPSCRLSAIGTDPVNGKPYKFQYGVTWVEGLYDYIDAIVPIDKPSVWKCPAAKSAQAGITAAEMNSAAVTYVFNFNLLEKQQNIIKNGSRMMVIRETDRLVASNTCAIPSVSPNNMAMFTSGITAPAIESNSVIYSPFFRAPDQATKKLSSPVSIAELNVKLHGAGSHILFADGHVKLYNAKTYYGASNPAIASNLAGSNYWDPTDKVFYNTTLSGVAKKTIQVTP